MKQYQHYIELGGKIISVLNMQKEISINFKNTNL